MRKFTSLLLMGLIIVSLFSIGSLANTNVLRVATEAGFMPFEFVDEKTNELVGFDMDLIREIGKILEMEVEIVNVGFDGLIPGILANQWDVVIAGVTITPEREESVSFSDPYYAAELAVLVRNDNKKITAVDQLEGAKVAVQIGTTGDLVATYDIEGINQVLRFNTVPEAILAVINRQADAAIIDLPVVNAYLKNNPNAPLKSLGSLFGEPDFFGIAVRKQNPELLEKINAALQQLKESGKYDEIYNKWFPDEN
ncbi:MAG: basic amino acid ABC transporter substrate-binding protein [Firmicutes bacterium]|nr:basic amino acid ABC transporter substrate-binding protein [Bacillota bacterium]